jgi:hypothetical protein
LLVVAFLVMVVSAVAMWFVHSSTLQSELNALRVQGFPTNGSELKDYYRVPEGESDTTRLWMDAIAAAVVANLSDARQSLPIVGDGPTPVPLPGNEWKQLEDCREFLSDVDEQLQQIRLACEAGGCVRFPVHFSRGLAAEMYQNQSCRSISQLLVLDAWVSAHVGDTERLLNDINGVLALSRVLRVEPSMNSQLVRTAFFEAAFQTTADLMAESDWSDSELMSLQEMFSTLDFRQSHRTGLVGERAVCLIEIKRVTPRIFYRPNATLALELYSRSIEGLSRGWSETIATQAAVAADLKSRNSGVISRMRLVAVTSLQPGLEQFVIAGALSTAEQRCVICAIAAERYRKIHGEFPQSLTQIELNMFAPSVQQSLHTTDPFSGQLLKYSVTEDGILIYSVGSDLTDDGGSMICDAASRQTDVGIRLRRKVPVRLP